TPLNVNAQEVVRQLRRREDRARLAQEVFGARLVSRKVARAEVRQYERTHACLRRHARGHARRRVRAADGERFVCLGEGRFVYEQVCVAREFDGAAAVGRVCAVDDRAPALCWAAEVRAVERATVGERDALAALESAVERAGRYAEFPRLLNVEVAGAILLRHAEAEGGQAVLERRAGDHELLVLEDQSFTDLSDSERVIRLKLSATADLAHVVGERARAVYVNGARVRGHAAGREQAHQPEHVVAVHVRDEDARDLTDIQFAAKQLVLRALAAVEEPDLGALRRSQCDARNVSRARRHARARPKESYPQSSVLSSQFSVFETVRSSRFSFPADVSVASNPEAPGLERVFFGVGDADARACGD